MISGVNKNRAVKLLTSLLVLIFLVFSIAYLIDMTLEHHGAYHTSKCPFTPVAGGIHFSSIFIFTIPLVSYQLISVFLIFYKSVVSHWSSQNRAPPKSFQTINNL